MRIMMIAAAAALAVGGTAHAKDMKSCSADYNTAKAGNALAGQSYLKFVSACMKGGTSVTQTATAKTPGTPATTAGKPTTAAPAVVAPSGSAPSGATAQCKDGTFSMAKHHSGSCSHHGGVAKFLQ